MQNSITALFLLSLFLMSCHKKNDDAIPQQNTECFYKTALDSAEVANKLLGKWKWQYSFSGWTGEYSDDVNKGLSFEFKSDGTMLVNRKGEEQLSVTWSLQPAVDSYYNLVATPYVNETLGFVLFCDDQLLFNGGAGDGTNNYFKRN